MKVESMHHHMGPKAGVVRHLRVKKVSPSLFNNSSVNAGVTTFWKIGINCPYENISIPLVKWKFHMYIQNCA